MTRSGPGRREIAPASGRSRAADVYQNVMPFLASWPCVLPVVTALTLPAVASQDPPAQPPDLAIELAELTRAANRANATIYTSDLRAWSEALT